MVHGLGWRYWDSYVSSRVAGAAGDCTYRSWGTIGVGSCYRAKSFVISTQQRGSVDDHWWKSNIAGCPSFFSRSIERSGGLWICGNGSAGRRSWVLPLFVYHPCTACDEQAGGEWKPADREMAGPAVWCAIDPVGTGLGKWRVEHGSERKCFWPIHWRCVDYCIIHCSSDVDGVCVVAANTPVVPRLH